MFDPPPFLDRLALFGRWHVGNDADPCSGSHCGQVSTTWLRDNQTKVRLLQSGKRTSRLGDQLCLAKTVVFPPGSSSVSYLSRAPCGFSIPGEPSGIPGALRPMALGFSRKPVDVGGRHVAEDDIPLNDRHVARGKFRLHATLGRQSDHIVDHL